MQRVLRRLPGLWRHLLKSKEVRQFLSSPLDTSKISRDAFLRQLDDVDNAACSWLSMVSGININVFHGFETEDDLVNYFLNDAYANNVTVIASKYTKYTTTTTATISNSSSSSVILSIL